MESHKQKKFICDNKFSKQTSVECGPWWKIIVGTTHLDHSSPTFGRHCVQDAEYNSEIVKSYPQFKTKDPAENHTLYAK